MQGTPRPSKWLPRQPGRGRRLRKLYSAPPSEQQPTLTDPYHPHIVSDVTQWMERTPPSHAFHPSMINSTDPQSYHRRKTSVTGLDTRPRTRKRETPPVPWFGRSSTDVSEHMYRAPPSHIAGQSTPQPTRKPLVRDDVWNQPSGAHETPTAISNHWWRDQPSSVHSVTVPPQYVSIEDLHAALPHRQSNLPRPSVVSVPEMRRPSPVDVHTPRSTMETPRSIYDNPGEKPRLDSSNQSDLGGRSRFASPRAASRALSSRSKRSLMQEQLNNRKENARPRFSAGGIVRPSPRAPQPTSKSFNGNSMVKPPPRGPILSPIRRASVDDGLLPQFTPRLNTAEFRGNRNYLQHNHPWRG